jgi:hypothetical protein
MAAQLRNDTTLPALGHMPELTRRRSTDAAPEECRHVYYGDVRVGTIANRSGIPRGEDPSGWSPCATAKDAGSGAAARETLPLVNAASE